MEKKRPQDIVKETPELPKFLVTIDVEGDSLWTKPSRAETRNAKCLPRFQTLCESCGFRPVYLTNYEMAKDEFYVEFARDILSRNAGEIGMHLHAWDSPPIVSITQGDSEYHTYLFEYPREAMRRKIQFMTVLLEDIFQTKMVSHRAGRWGLDKRYAKILVEQGYRVDCSVTPFVSWRHKRGAPDRSGGSDYRGFPDHAYFLDLDDIGRPGNSPLLEVPLTIASLRGAVAKKMAGVLNGVAIGRRIAARLFPEFVWLRPDGKNLKMLLRLIRKTLGEKKDYLQFMIHSSELMAGGHPGFQRQEDIERLYADIEALFRSLKGRVVGATLGEYWEYFCETRGFPRDGGAKDSTG